jgi:hypothetical protein
VLPAELSRPLEPAALKALSELHVSDQAVQG